VLSPGSIDAIPSPPCALDASLRQRHRQGVRASRAGGAL